MDLAFVVDSSGSISRSNFRRLKKMLKGLLEYLNVGPDGTHAAMVAYSTDAKVEFKFDTFLGSDITVENYAAAFDVVKHQEGYTYINLGLRLAKEELFTTDAGMRPDAIKVSPC